MEYVAFTANHIWRVDTGGTLTPTKTFATAASRGKWGFILRDVASMCKFITQFSKVREVYFAPAPLLVANAAIWLCFWVQRPGINVGMYTYIWSYYDPGKDCHCLMERIVRIISFRDQYSNDGSNRGYQSRSWLVPVMWRVRHESCAPGSRCSHMQSVVVLKENGWLLSMW